MSSQKVSCFGPDIYVAGVAMHLALLAALFYAPQSQDGNIQRILYFHVPSAWVSFLAFFVTFIASIMVLSKKSFWWDGLATSSAEVGLLFCTLALVTGSIWSRGAWGAWWVWDARLTTTLVLWLTYAAYSILRTSSLSPERSSRFCAVYAVIGFINVPFVFLSTRVGIRTMHRANVSMTSEMRHTLLFSLFAFTLLYVAFVRGRSRLEAMRRMQ